MITACELCTKITVENTLREEAILIAKMEAAKVFAEEILSPILSQLTEVPNHFFIGYRYSGRSSCGLYRRISNWKDGFTSRYYPKRERDLADEVGGNLIFSNLDYEVLNQYLAKFGFQIDVETKRVCMTEYSSSVKNVDKGIDFLYISMICPIEDF